MSEPRFQRYTVAEWRSRYELAIQRLAEHDAARDGLGTDQPIEGLDEAREMLEAAAAHAFVGYKGASRNAGVGPSGDELKPTAAEILRKKAELKRRGLPAGYPSLARELGPVSVSTIRRRLGKI